MNKSLKGIIAVMIAVVVASGVYLWVSAGSGDDILKKLDAQSFDISATCNMVDGNLLICNKDNDAYLVLDDVKVYKEKVQTVINKKGDESKTFSYKDASFSDIESGVKDSNEISLKMWLTPIGKVKIIMISEETYQDENESKTQLEGLDPSSYTSENVVLAVTPNTIKLAPANYNAKEADKFAALINDYKFAVKTLYYNVDITVTADKDGNESRNIQYRKSTAAELNKDLTVGKRAYVWMTKYGNVYAVMTVNEIKK